MILWAVNLLPFYSERVAQYDEAEIVSDWIQGGRLGVVAWNCGETVRYFLRDHPEVQFLDKPSGEPFLLISKSRPLNDDGSWRPIKDYLETEGYEATLIDQRPPAHPESLQYSGSLYFPPVGLCVYRVAKAENLLGRR